MIAKFARLEFEIFTKPSKLDFLRVHQSGGHKIKLRLICLFEKIMETPFGINGTLF
jgi:hypothetical protein